MRFMLYGLALADRQPEDDIDQLFNWLPRVEPPDGLITRILSHIGHLPAPSADSLSIQHAGQKFLAGEGLETLIIHNEKQEPS